MQTLWCAKTILDAAGVASGKASSTCAAGTESCGIVALAIACTAMEALQHCKLAIRCSCWPVSRGHWSRLGCGRRPRVPQQTIRVNCTGAAPLLVGTGL